MAGIDLHEVEKVFPDGARALSPLSLSVPHGEFLVLLGPSGCGKSTLLRLVAGLEEPTAGEIRIDGQAVNHLAPRERNVAMVFQNYALYPHRTVRGNLEFPLRMQKVPRHLMRERVQAVARSLEIETLLARRPRELSGGQAQRVAMGRAAVRDPAVFLMDEPLSNLDAKLRIQLRNEVAALQRRTGTTTIYVTHDQVEAMTLGHRVAVLNAGRLQQLGQPQTLYHAPANLFVAHFLGTPPMNIFRPAVHVEGGQVFLDTDACSILLGDDATWSKLVKLSPERLFAGLRPEALQWPEHHPGLPVVEVRAEGVEALGHEQIVYFSGFASAAPVDDNGPQAAGLQGHGLMAARLSADRPVAPGQRFRVALDVGRLYWFGRDGIALAHPARP